MNKELKHDQIKAYAEQLANELMQGHFRFDDRITGDKIKNFAPIKQVNLFILKNLFDQWRKETEKLESPYFNYHHREVKEELHRFMNVLSRHIEIKEDAFRPLLIQSIEDALILTLDPSIHVKQEAQNLGEPAVSFKRLQNHLKYYHIHKVIFQGLLDELKRSGKKEFLAGELIKTTNGVMADQRFNERAIREHLQTFNEISPVRYENLIVTQEIANPLVEKEEAHRESETDFFSDLETEETNTDTFSPAKENTTAQNLEEEDWENHEFSTEEKPVQESEYMNARGNSPLPDRPSVKRQEQNQNEHKPKTLKDQLPGYGSGPARSSHLVPNKPLKKSISLNQKFMFINDLFKGEKEVWEKACDELDDCASYHEAVQLLNQTYAKRFNWDMNSSKVQDLLDHLEQRYQKQSA